ncbi:MAG: TolC family outer membrane protein [Methylovulum sp.]|jgi:outer membrane protein|nr:TolC family outer membrane protein [Methylovulum sp.]MCF7999573.1 TolC family outer membrane protein [Methylovulum sp.]
MMRHSFFIIISLAYSLTAHAGNDDLMSLYERAVQASPELNGSEYALEIAKAREAQSVSKLMPQITATGNYSLNQFSSTRNTLTTKTPYTADYPGVRASVNLQQPLFDLQSYLLMRSQQSLTSQGEEELLAAHQKLIADLVERYMDALEARDKSQIITDELSSTEKQLERVKAMHARQLAMVTDLYELQARTETLRASLIDSDNDARIALEKLRELTGDAISGIQTARLDAVQPAPEGTIDSWVQQAGRINPQLQALKHAVEAARISINAYQAGYLPTIQLQLSEVYSDTSYNNQQSPPFEIGTAAVQATVPIYEGGITTARIKEAEARKKYTETQLEQKLRELEKLTRAAYLDMTTSPARNQAADRQLVASEKSRDAKKKGYELGVVTIVDVLNAEKELSEARKLQRQARYRYIRARSSLYYETGQLIGVELAQMNTLFVEPVSAGKK